MEVLGLLCVVRDYVVSEAYRLVTVRFLEPKRSYFNSHKGLL
jgi:hypothetical protein